MKVLLVDDSKAARFAMRNLLEKQGLEVEMATSGEEALEQLSSAPADVVFMDQSMPGMGGIVATEKIKSDPATSHIPVVICTGNEGPKLEQVAAEAGAVGVLTKPPKAEKLKVILDSIETAATVAVEPVEIPVSAEAGAEIKKLLDSISALQQAMTKMEKGLQEKITHAIHSADAKIKPLQETYDNMQDRMVDQIKDHIKADGSNQRIQLEALRQQVESGLEDMADREIALKKDIAATASRDMITLLNQRLGGLKDAAEQLQSSTNNKLRDMEQQVAGMQKKILVTSSLISIVAAGAAFAAAFFLL